MTTDEAKAIIDSIEGSYTVKAVGKVDRIYDGLTLMKKYHSNIRYAVGRNQIWCGVDFDESVAEMSDEDVRSMAEMGWFQDEDSWSHFV